MNIMIQDVSIGGYVPGVSVMHRLDPRTKLVGLIVLLIGVFATRTDVGLLVISCVVVTLVFLCRVGWRIWWWGLLRFSWMLLIARGDQHALQLERPTHQDWRIGASHNRAGSAHQFDAFGSASAGNNPLYGLDLYNHSTRPNQRLGATSPALETPSRAGGGSRRHTVVGDAVRASAATGAADHC